MWVPVIEQLPTAAQNMNTPPTMAPGEPEWPVLNIERSLVRLGGDRSLLRDLAKFFVEDSDELLTNLQDALNARDAKLASRTAHSLGGQSANFSADNCTFIAKAIENATQSGDFETSAAMLISLQREVSRLTDALRRDVLTDAE